MHAPLAISTCKRAAGGGVVAVTGLISAVNSISTETLLFVGVVAVAVLVAWPRPAWLAWLAGFIFCVNELDGVPNIVPQAVNLALVYLVVVRFRPGLGGEARRTVGWIFGLLVALVALVGVFGVIRDPVLPALRFAGLYLVTVLGAGMLARRAAAHRPLLMGFVAGTAASSTVALWQAFGVDLLRVASHGEGRYPGLALEAPGVSWHAAAAIPVAVFVIKTATAARARRWAWVGLVLSVFGMAVCGAQGGILGLAAAAGVCVVLAWRQLDHRMLGRTVVVAIAALGSSVIVLAVAGVDIPSFSAVYEESSRGYENEVARVRAAGYGLEQWLESPLTGIGTTAYDDRYAVRPHVLPLNLSVTTGVLGLVVGAGLVGLVAWTILRGPVDRRSPQGWLGVAMLTTMFTHAMLTPSGPFARIDRISLLLIAAVLARGGAPNLEGEAADDEPGHGGAVEVSSIR